MPQDFGAGAPDIGRSFNSASSSYEIWFRSIDFDIHMSRMFGDNFDRNVVEQKWGMEGGVASWANHEYIEIMNPDKKLNTRFHGLGVSADSEHPTGFKMGPNGRLIGLVANTGATPVSMDPIFHDDAHFDQVKYPGQLQKVDNRDENKLVATVNEEQMLQIKLAMLKATNQINRDNPGFGLMGKWDPNSNSYRATMGQVVGQTANLLDIKADTKFDPDGVSPGTNNIIPVEPVQLFKGSLEDLRQEVARHEQINAEHLKALRQNIDADLSQGTAAVKVIVPGVDQHSRL